MSDAASITGREKPDWGVGLDDDSIGSSLAAVVASANRLTEELDCTQGRDERILDIINYMQIHYAAVTLEELGEQFHLTPPYLSKYIRTKTGETFQEAVKKARMKKARILLKDSGQKVEAVAAAVGYENVEHFNRLFKKAYGMTPLQFRCQNE